jgi:hypothetical protein
VYCNIVLSGIYLAVSSDEERCDEYEVPTMRFPIQMIPNDINTALTEDT